MKKSREEEGEGRGDGRNGKDILFGELRQGLPRKVIFGH